MKIGIFCLHYGWLTGSEMYFYELTKLLKNDFNITLHSNINYKLSNNTILDGVKYLNLTDNIPPNEYDIIIVSHGNFLYNRISQLVLNLNNTPIINICHSEVLPQEEPLIKHNVKYYVGIRQSIVDKLINTHNIPKNKVKLIYNPIDTNRFNSDTTSLDGCGLFVGTMNNLRLEPFKHFVKECKTRGLNVRYVGDVSDEIKNQFKEVEFLKPLWEIEYYIKSSELCGGIINGRTFWEAKLCGKNVLEYTINSNGVILGISDGLNEDINVVKDTTVKKQILELINE